MFFTKNMINLAVAYPGYYGKDGHGAMLTLKNHFGVDTKLDV